MAIWGDYHTHTVYSHGKGTVEENIQAAIKCGLKEIAITDHGFKHFTYNVRRMDFPFMQKDVDNMRKKYPDIKIHLGLETNFNSAKGNIDMVPEDIAVLDIVVCGYHKFVKPDRFSDCYKFWFPNFVLDTLGKSTAKMTALNTDAYIKALDKYPIDIVSHPNYSIKTDIVEVAKACKHYGTYFELNGKRISMTNEEIEGACNTGVEFICNSDAHDVGSIGNVDIPMAKIKELGIPLEQVANWERLPVLRSAKIKDKLKQDEPLL